MAWMTPAGSYRSYGARFSMGGCLTAGEGVVEGSLT